VDETFQINLGNDRRNISMALCGMRAAAKDLVALNFILDEHLSGKPLKWTIIFFNTQELTQQGFRHLKKQLPLQYQDQIGFLHALCTTDAKRKTMELFCDGTIKILCATEAAGMVSYCLCYCI
jgi:superfamily II DNA/RNA helicase